jgi:predicted nucleic acid-binding protein
LTVYIDTSVLAAYYCPEPGSAAAQKRLARAKQPVISPLVEIELYSAVAAKVRARELDAASAGRVLDLFRKHLAEGCYGVVSIGMGEYALARDWIGRFSSPLRAADALHLAAAFANGVTLLTADKALAQSAAHFGVRHELVP